MLFRKGLLITTPLAALGLFFTGSADAVAQLVAPRLEVVEELRIDGYAADLVAVNCVLVDRDGAMTLCQRQDRAVRFFGADGRALGAVGRPGEGPGEFRGINNVGWVGDTLWVFDGQLGRLSFIDSRASRLLRTTPVVPAARPSGDDGGRYPTFSFISPYAVHGDGSIQAMVAAAQGPMVDARYETLTNRFRVSGEGVLTAKIFEYDDGDYNYFIRTPGGAVAGGAYPFAIRPHFAVAPDGSRSVLVKTVLGTGDQGTLDIAVVDSLGDTLRAWSVPFVGVRIPRQVADSAIDAGFESRRLMPEVATAYRVGARVPPVYPPVEGVVVGADGTLWLRLRPIGEVRPHALWDASGAPLGTVELPLGVEVMAVSLTHVWAVSRDPLDVESVVRYRVR